MTIDNAGHAKVRVSAPAKLNLALHVTGRRPDGYHLLESLVAFTAFGDTITIEYSIKDRISVHGPYASALPEQTAFQDNLAGRAINAFRQRSPLPPVHLTIEKHIPVAAGIGGGSADAAAALLAANALAEAPLADDILMACAASLGADVPMCLRSAPLIARGVGDQLQLLSDHQARPVVLINPNIPISTPDVFKRLTKRNNERLPHPPDADSDMISWLQNTRNDLSEAAKAIAPVISNLETALQDHGAEFARMSGSGATVFGLFANKDQARLAAHNLSEQNPDWFVTATELAPHRSPLELLS